MKTIEIKLVENRVFTYRKTLTETSLREHTESGSKRFVEQQASEDVADLER
jgi:hypothetical protein